jgi:PIN like domain
MSLRAAQVRIYVDADMLGLGKIIASLRNDVTYPGDPGAEIHRRQRPPCPITSPDVLDTDWIPEVAARGWLIVTRDSMIIQNRNGDEPCTECTDTRISGWSWPDLNPRPLDANLVPVCAQPAGKEKGQVRSSSSTKLRRVWALSRQL